MVQPPPYRKSLEVDFWSYTKAGNPWSWKFNFAKNPLLEATGVASGGCCKIKLAMVVDYYLSIRNNKDQIWIGLQKKRWRGSFFLLPVQPMNETGWVWGQFFGLIHDDCVRVCDGEAMVGVMCVGPLVVVVVISVGIPKKNTYNFSKIPCKTGNFRLLYFSIVWRGSMMPPSRFLQLVTKGHPW